MLTVPGSNSSIGTDGNAFAVLSAAKAALREPDYDAAWIAAFDEVSSGDYDHLLATCIELVRRHVTPAAEGSVNGRPGFDGSALSVEHGFAASSDTSTT